MLLKLDCITRIYTLFKCSERAIFAFMGPMIFCSIFTLRVCVLVLIRYMLIFPIMTLSDTKHAPGAPYIIENNNGNWPWMLH